MTQIDTDIGPRDPGEDFPYKQETYRILGACFEVYNEKGCGFLEAVYQECLAKEFDLQGIPYVAQKALPLQYKGHALKQVYQPDFICFEKVVVELKAVSRTADEHRAQTINYLHAGDLEVALLVNFGHFPKLEYQRLVRSSRTAIVPANICVHLRDLRADSPGGVV